MNTELVSNEQNSFTNAKDIYLDLLKIEKGEKLPTLEALPLKMEIPIEISNYIRNILQRQKELKSEQEGIVVVENGAITFLDILSGKASSYLPSEIYKRAFLNNPMLIHIHSHPEGNSFAPSTGDLELFKTLNQGSYSYIIVSDRGICMLLQTKESMAFPLSSKLNGMIAAFRAEDLLMDISREVHTEVEGNAKFNRAHALDGINEAKVFDLYEARVTAVLTKSGFGYYTFKGNILDEEAAITLLKS